MRLKSKKKSRKSKSKKVKTLKKKLSILQILVKHKLVDELHEKPQKPEKTENKKLPTTVYKKIEPPPEFMNPSPFIQEGYWSSKEDSTKNYFPIISKQKWKDKNKFVNMVKLIEQNIEDEHENKPEKLKYKGNYVKSYRGVSNSRIDDSYVGNSEYFFKLADTKKKSKSKSESKYMIWPSRYVEHYIEKYNVMPTKRFYNFIIDTYTKMMKI
jgi:methionine aminopeptidase